MPIVGGVAVAGEWPRGSHATRRGATLGRTLTISGLFGLTLVGKLTVSLAGSL